MCNSRRPCPLVYVLALLAVVALLLEGCTQRQEILEQTVRVKGETVAARMESSHVPDELLTWEILAEVDTGFEKATAVAFGDDDGLHVAGDDALRRMTEEGAIVWQFTVGAEPTAIDLSHGMTWVATRDRVVRYSVDGSPLQEIVPRGERTWITSIAANPEAVYVADAGNRRYLVYSVAGALQGELAAMDPDRGIPALSVPSPHLDVQIGAGGNLWLTNPGRRSVQVHSPIDGALVSSFGRSANDIDGFSGCCNPTDIALLPDGRVVTSEKGIPRVKVLSAQGELLSVVAPPEEFGAMTAGVGLSTDSQGRIAVLDPDRGIVRIYAEQSGVQEVQAE